MFKKYLIENGHTSYVLDDNLIIHTKSVIEQEAVLKAFFGWLSTNVDLPRKKRKMDNEVDDMIEPVVDDSASIDDPVQTIEGAANSQTISVSCMQSYKSAIKHHYTANRVKMDENLNYHLDNVIKGYIKRQ